MAAAEPRARLLRPETSRRCGAAGVCGRCAVNPWGDGSALLGESAAMTLPPETLHLPFESGPFRMAMGLIGLAPSELIELDERYPEELAERRALLDVRHAEVFAACPESEPARTEVLQRVATVLSSRWPELFPMRSGVLYNRMTGEEWSLTNPRLDPLEVAGRLVQEDLCIIRPDPDGPVLDAAVLCFPSRWRLAEKVGRPLAEVHRPVPLYSEHLSRPVDRFMDQLKPGRLAVRLNWSVVDDPALFQPTGHFGDGMNANVTADNAGARTWLRVERQSLSRLPGGSVLFGIRVHVYPLGVLANRPDDARRLMAAIQALPDTLAAYKSLWPIRAAVLAWLMSRTVSPV